MTSPILTAGPIARARNGVIGREGDLPWRLKTDLANAGAHWQDAPVVTDGPLITSRKPDDIPQFTDAVVRALQ